ncbi:MAG: 30S ribosomal protein S12 methylthiotransferase RimO [Desulfobacterales bacterium]|nr:30S ribosomal protein S12 methylthiotransferase RimO [Desulfobacterales bacterium]
MVSLGCARNQVDSEVMLGRLTGAGWRVTVEPTEAEVIIVNTCSFIEAAVSESLDTILELAKLKREARCRYLVVAGCLPERYRENLALELPEVDLFLGTGAFDRIVEAVDGRLNLSRCLLPDPDRATFQAGASVRLPPVAASAYLKIAEGCSKTCTYCIIPKLRGRQRSRTPADIIAEAAALIEAGAGELVLVAQDTTAYGRDLDPPADLADLLEKLAMLSPRTWIRFLYGHPESIAEPVIRAVARYPNVCSYFDIPIQHVSPAVLRRMGRTYSETHLTKLFAHIKSIVPDAALRTTVIVGFPGETDQDFDMLLRFLDRVRFDHLGTFIYSDAEDLPSHRLPGHVSPKIARKRHDRVMARQAGVSLQNNQRHLGATYAVLVEENPEAGLFAGRTFFQAPEVDGVTYIHGTDLQIGEFAGVKITEALEYDLAGVAR